MTDLGPGGLSYTPMERIFAWLGAWALDLSFFFSSSPLLPSVLFTSGRLLSSFFFFLSKRIKTSNVKIIHLKLTIKTKQTKKTSTLHNLGSKKFIQKRHDCKNRHNIRKVRRLELSLLPAGEAPLADTLWERMMLIQPSTSTEASFLNSTGGGTQTHAGHKNSHITAKTDGWRLIDCGVTPFS